MKDLSDEQLARRLAIATNNMDNARKVLTAARESFKAASADLKAVLAEQRRRENAAVKLAEGKHPRLTEDERAELGRTLAARYLDGESVREISESIGRSYFFVHTALESAGVTFRPMGVQPQGRGRDGKFTRPQDTPSAESRNGFRVLHWDGEHSRVVTGDELADVLERGLIR